jgi:hypothetical protein
MTDKKISELDALGTTPAADDVFPVVDDDASTTKKVAWSDMAIFLENVVEDTTPQLGGDLDVNDKNITLKFEPTSDDTPSGLIITVTVDTNAVGVGAPLFIAADGHFDTAEAGDNTTSPAVVLALETGTGSKKVLLHGIMRNDGWDWTTGPGDASLIYLHTTTGQLIQTKPSGADEVIQPVGWALSDDCIYFCPSMIYFTHT